jgi:hypothetical protein
MVIRSLGSPTMSIMMFGCFFMILVFILLPTLVYYFNSCVHVALHCDSNIDYRRTFVSIYMTMIWYLCYFLGCLPKCIRLCHEKKV